MLVFDTNIRLYTLPQSTTNSLRQPPFQAPRVNTAAGNRVAFRLKELLKTVGWTVVSSSDGTTFGAGDQITLEGMGAGGMCNDLAWFVVQQPAGGRQLCFQGTNFGTPGGEMPYWRVKYSLAAGFTGGTPTETAAASDEQFVLGGGPDASPFFDQWCAVQNQNGWCHMAADNAAPYGFFVAGYGLTDSTAMVAFVFDPLVSGTYPAADPDPYVIYASRGGGPWDSEVESPASRAWIDFGGGGQAWAELGGLRFYNVSGEKNANPFNKKFDRMPLIWVDYQTTNQIKGQSSLMYRTNHLTTFVVSGKTFQRVTPRDTILVGGIFLPWNGSLPNR